MKDFETVPHTADLKIIVYGKTLEQLFEHAVEGMFQIVRPRTSQPDCAYREDRIVCESLSISRQIEVSSWDLNALLVDMLSQLLSLSDIYNEAYLKARVVLEGERVAKVSVHGIPIRGFEGVEIKAVTYAQVEIKKINEVWETALVFDI